MDRSEWVHRAQAVVDRHSTAPRARLVRVGTEAVELLREALDAPPPPAEQASGEHVETLRKIRDRTQYRLRDAQGYAESDPIRAQLAAIDAAIAALSQRSVVKYVRWHPKHGFRWDALHDAPIGDETGCGWIDVPLTAATRATP